MRVVEVAETLVVVEPPAVVEVRTVCLVVAVRELVLGPGDVTVSGTVLVSGGPSVTVKPPSARLPGGPVSRTVYTPGLLAVVAR